MPVHDRKVVFFLCSCWTLYILGKSYFYAMKSLLYFSVCFICIWFDHCIKDTCICILKKKKKKASQWLLVCMPTSAVFCIATMNICPLLAPHESRVNNWKTVHTEDAERCLYTGADNEVSTIRQFFLPLCHFEN